MNENTILIKIDAGGDPTSIEELCESISENDELQLLTPLRTRGTLLSEIVITLGTIGAFEFLWSLLKRISNKNETKEFTLTKDKTSISFKGYSQKDINEVIKALAPELIEEKKNESE